MSISQFPHKTFVFCLSLSLSFVLSLSNPVRASSIEPPPGPGAPSGTVGGASRSVLPPCRENSARTTTSLMAFNPVRQKSLTSAEHPKGMVYLSQTAAQRMEFNLLNKYMEGIYGTNIVVPGKMSLVSFRIPKTAPAFKKSTPYYWTVAVACNEYDRTEDWIVDGRIEGADLD